MSRKIMDKIGDLQEKYEKYLPESIRDDAEAIEYSLAYNGVYEDATAHGLAELNKVQELAADIVLWTVEMFEAWEEGELEEGDKE